MLLLAFSLSLATVRTASAAWGVVEKRLTTSLSNQISPQVQGTNVVYGDNRNGNEDIYRYDLSANEEARLTTNGANQMSPAIWGDRVVWDDNRAGNWDIYSRLLASGSTENALVSSPAQQNWPDIDSNLVVYHDPSSGNMDVYLYDISTSSGRRLTNNSSAQRNASIWGSAVVYEDDRNGNWDIYSYNVTTNIETRLSSNAANQIWPAIDKGRVVYEDNRNGNSDIYLYDLGTGTETRLTSNLSNQTKPSISGSLVVYEDNRNGNSDIYLYDIGTGTEQRLTTDAAAQQAPCIDGLTVVWTDMRNGNADVYSATLTPANPATISGMVTSGGTPVPGVLVQCGPTPPVLSGPDGRYTLTGVPAGVYDLVFSKDGYSTQVATGIVAGAGKTVTRDANLVSTKPGSLTGSVMCNGLLVSDVSVQIGSAPATTTRADGQYSASGIPAGTYSVTFSKEGYISQTIDGVEIKPDATAVLDVQLLQAQKVPGVLTGTVTGALGPLGGVTVTVGAMAPVITSVTGTYTVSGIEAGTYSVTYAKSGYSPVTLTDVVVAEGASVTRDVRLTEVTVPTGPGALAGTVVDGNGRALPWVMVQVGDMRPVSTDASGRYIVNDVPAGTYTVMYVKEGYPTQLIQNVSIPAEKTVTKNVTLANPTAKYRVSISRSPSAKTITYRRRSGTARYTLAATVRKSTGGYLKQTWIYLQTSKNGKSGWRNSYKLKTSSYGKATRAFTTRTTGSRYYRWYVPGSASRYSSTTGVQRVIVR